MTSAFACVAALLGNGGVNRATGNTRPVDADVPRPGGAS